MRNPFSPGVLPADDTGEWYGSTGKNRPDLGPTTDLESQVCTCGHTYYLHGDRAVALCGGVERGYEPPEGLEWRGSPRCTCQGFRLVQKASEPGREIVPIAQEAVRA